MRNHYLYYCLVALGAAFLLSCNAQNSAATATDPAAVPTALSSNPVADILEPNEPGLSYPIYESFDSIAPLFEQEDGKVYVINFWATWCKPCVEELPYFEKLAAEMGGENVQIIMVSLDFARDVRTKLKDFIEQRPMELPVVALADQQYNNWIDRVDRRWGGAIPITILYKNQLRSFHDTQYASYSELQQAVTALL